MDLEQAVAAYEFSGETPSSLTMPSVNVARTLLAYAYLNTGEYGKAADMAVAASNNDSHKILPLSQVLTTGFNSVSNNGNNWMWGIDVTLDNSGGLATFWGHMDAYTYSYASVGDFMCIDDTLFSQIPQKDIRRQWFMGDEDSYSMPIILALQMLWHHLINFMIQNALGREMLHGLMT